MNWTLAYNGTEKLLADWGIAQVTRKLVSQGVDELTFKLDGASADSTPLFAPYGPAVTLWRNRTIASNGTFSGGTPWFQGIVTQVPRAGAPDAESQRYRVAGPWWYLDNLVFQQPYENILLGFAVRGDPTTAIYGPANSSHLFLNQGNANNALTKITTGQQIIEALNWALLPFVKAGVTPPFQIGAVTPTVDVPIDEVRDITCAEVIHKMLRWSPDAVAWFDYTTSPPTFNCKRRAELTIANLDVSGAGAVRDFSVNARYDLQAPSVQIFYETVSSVNGQSSLSLVTDFYPNPLPTDPQKQFRPLQFTVNLQGVQASTTTAKITCDPLAPTDDNWWLGKHPQYEPHDPSDPADADNSIASFTIDPASIERAPNPDTDSKGNPVKDLGYTNELTTGQLTSWMAFKSQRLTLQCNAIIEYRNGTKPQVIPLTYQCLSTNATNGTYTNQTINAFPEPVPVGLAQFLYQAISALQFEGGLTLQEEDVSGALSLGQVFNLTGGALAEWSTMQALVQEVTEALDTGATTIRFGPPRNLSAGELVDLLRVNRDRIIFSSYSMRASGSPGDAGSNNVALGQNTPEKNSVSGTAPMNPHIISSTVDGSGAIVTHAATEGDCSTTWISNPLPGGGTPTPGSVIISLSAAGGRNISIRSVSLCQNGVSGSQYFLCSDFIPDA